MLALTTETYASIYNLTANGTALVIRGLNHQGKVDGIMTMAVEIVVGAVIAAASTGWGQERAFASHMHWVAGWAAMRAPPPA